MGRLAWYAGVSFLHASSAAVTDSSQVSTALAGGVIVSAFNQRANFYSACVYLAQSNLCLMVSSGISSRAQLTDDW
jgi:E3 ubiquitin-protein ligase synoviolin